MSTTLQCDCGQTIRLSADFAHRWTTCPACGQRVGLEASLTDDFEYTPAPEKSPDAFQCSSCSKWFPPEQLKQVDDALTCGRCRLREAESARAQRSMITNAIVAGVVVLVGVAVYMFVLKDMFTGGPAKSRLPVAAKDVQAKAPVAVGPSTADARPVTPVVPPESPATDGEIEPPVTTNGKPAPPVTPVPSRPVDLATYAGAHLITVATKANTIVIFKRDSRRQPVHELKVFDLVSKAVLKSLDMTFRIDAMAVSDDGRHLMTVGRDGRDGELRLWDLETLSVKARSAVLEPFGKVGIAPDGLTAWSLGPQEGMRFVDARTGKVELFRGTHIASAYAEFSPRRNLAVVKCIHTSGQWIDIFDLASRRKTHKLDPRESFGCLALSPDGTLLAIGFLRRVDVYETRGWRIRTTLSRGQHRNAPERLLITDDNRRVIELPFGADGRTPVIRDMIGGDARQVAVENCIDWAIGPRGELVVLSEGEVVKSFDVATGAAVE